MFFIVCFLMCVIVKLEFVNKFRVGWLYDLLIKNNFLLVLILLRLILYKVKIFLIKVYCV